jgi:cytochrome c-type biogenesis protein CcmH
MTLFWIFTGAMALAAALILTTALMRGQRAAEPGAASDLQVYRDQLAEVDRDLARGVIPPEEAERLRTEVSRRILAADTAARSGAAGARRQPKLVSTAMAALVVIAVIGGGYGVYLAIGAPGYPDLPRAERIAAAEAARADRPGQAEAEASMPAAAAPDVPQDYLDLVQRLRGTVAERPDDLQGLTLLARSEAALGNYVAAYQAQQRILSVKGAGATAQDYADLADMMVLAAGGYVSPEAERALDAALTRDPRNGAARYYRGLMLAQTGRPDQAFRIWDGLLRESTPTAPWVPPIRAQIEEMAFRAGVSNYAPPEPLLRGPSQDDIAAASEMSPEDRAAMIAGMVENLAQRLATEGGPPAQWAQLITGLGVLGDTERARAVWEEAQRVFDGMDDALQEIGAAAAQAGVAR